MKRFACAAALALVLCAALPAAPALASDFYTPSPVPSTRNNPVNKAKKTDKKTQIDTNNFILNKKIVKTTKSTGGTSSPGEKKPGAL